MGPYFKHLAVEQCIDQMLLKSRDHDLRITPQRLTELKILAAGKSTLFVKSIYETVKPEFPTTRIATTYKTIHRLK